MLPYETASVFFGASVILALAPGPDNIFVLSQSALYGWRTGVLVTLGLCTGVLVHTAAVALGLAALLQTSEFAFNAVKLVGAAFLLYLAWKAFTAKTESLDSENASLDTRSAYLRGVVLNVTNPKVAIFFLAFLPQFASPAIGSVPIQIFQLGCLFIIATLVVFSLVAVFSGLVGDLLRRSTRAQTWLNRIAAIVFISLAVHLVASQLPGGQLARPAYHHHAA